MELAFENLFARRPTTANDGPRQTIKKALAQLLPDIATSTVTISEVRCGDRACGGTETIVLILGADRAGRALRLAGPMASVTTDRLRQALAMGDLAELPV